ncbi:MAG: hypothetical protein AAF546_06325 [Verrucomicrobiota bacterium]
MQSPFFKNTSLFVSSCLLAASAASAQTSINETFDNTTGDVLAFNDLSPQAESSQGYNYFTRVTRDNGDLVSANNRENAVRYTTTGELEFVYGGALNGARTMEWPALMWFGLTDEGDFFSSANDITFSIDATLTAGLEYRLLLDIDDGSTDGSTIDGSNTQLYVSDTGYTGNISDVSFSLTDASQWLEMSPTNFMTDLSIASTNPGSMLVGNVHRVGLYISGSATTGSTVVFDNFDFVAVPEPAAAMLFAGIFSFAWVALRRRRA